MKIIFEMSQNCYILGKSFCQNTISGETGNFNFGELQGDLMPESVRFDAVYFVQNGQKIKKCRFTLFLAVYITHFNYERCFTAKAR